jgi:Ca2+-binding RTX toxin-like protein
MASVATTRSSAAAGAASDFFRFNDALGASNVDQITDFVHGADKFQLENTGTGLFNAFVVTGALAAADFAKGAGLTTALDATDRIIYNTTTGELFYDKDGTGAAAAVKFAVITTHPATITEADFIII